MNRHINKPAKRKYITNLDLSREETDRVLEHAQLLSVNKSSASAFDHKLNAAVLFQKTSTRTRISFETGMSDMGINTIFVDWNQSNFVLADLRDEAKVLSQYVDLIIARFNSHSDLLTLADNSDVTVINGMTDLYHPCQALADFQTILERFGTLDCVTIAYVGDVANVCQSLIQLSSLYGVRFHLSFPKGYEPYNITELTNLDNVSVFKTPSEAVKNATVVYTDSWIGIGMNSENDVMRKNDFSSFQVDEKLFEQASKDAVFMHCLPAHRGEEVTDGVMDSSSSTVFEQARNRKYAQMALVHHLMT